MSDFRHLEISVLAAKEDGRFTNVVADQDLIEYLELVENGARDTLHQRLRNRYDELIS